MKTKFRLTMVLGILTAAIVVAGVPLGKQTQWISTTTEVLMGCYTEQEITLLVKENHYQREQAIVLLELACENAITPK